MIAQYKGMRWLKCDLQVQTPEDSKHWLDDDLRLLDPRRPKVDGKPSEDNIQEKARSFLYRCHELKLDVIGLTDHNFSSKTDPRDWFGVHLVEQNRAMATECGRDPLVFLPGFEIDIGYHLLCLFEPAKKQRDFENCNRILTTLGLPEDRRFERGEPCLLQHDGQRLTLKKLLDIVQGEYGGIVIGAHADQASGIFENTAHKEDYRNPGLLALELTKNPPSEKYAQILGDKNSHWRRESSHPAWIMSSDAKSLKQVNGNPRENSLGYRYTWIKMSIPSINGLRQAFLDHESRIRKPTVFTVHAHPDEEVKRSVIDSISFKCTSFLQDATLTFSPSLNCIIGGRGSGKSTVLEYLRIALGGDDEDCLDSASHEKVQRIKSTLKEPGAEIRIKWKSDQGVEDTMVWSSEERSVEGIQLEDPATFFRALPVSFYSQQQLNSLTASDSPKDGKFQARRLRELIDGFNSSALHQLSDDERNLIPKIHEAFTKQKRRKELEDQHRKVLQEYNELKRQWQARTDIQDDARRHQALRMERACIEHVELSNKDLLEELRQTAKRMISLELSVPEDSPNQKWFDAYGQSIKTLQSDLAETILEKASFFEQSTDALLLQDPQWPEIKSMIERSDEDFRSACESKGLSSEDVGRLQEIAEQIKVKEADLERITREIHDTEEAASRSEEKLKSLHIVWNQQFKQRQQAAEKANELARVGDAEKKFIEVSVERQSDVESFQKLWEDFSPKDGRKRLSKYWSDIGNDLFDKFGSAEIAESPWELLDRYANSSDDTPPEFFKGCQEEFKEHISINFQDWITLRCSRVDDVIDMKLFRADGTSAGSIGAGSLSDGQRNTAALALLLTQSGGPLVIDQPEDELDSNFVFKELIPMLRQVKNRRQLIMSTHNANLPVNGDAEYVCAFEAAGGQGVIKSEGGLDLRNVTDSVLEIMEGSAEAFRRRREKYHF